MDSGHIMDGGQEDFAYIWGVPPPRPRILCSYFEDVADGCGDCVLSPMVSSLRPCTVHSDHEDAAYGCGGRVLSLMVPSRIVDSAHDDCAYSCGGQVVSSTVPSLLPGTVYSDHEDFAYGCGGRALSSIMSKTAPVVIGAVSSDGLAVTSLVSCAEMGALPVMDEFAYGCGFARLGHPVTDVSLMSGCFTPKNVACSYDGASSFSCGSGASGGGHKARVEECRPAGRVRPCVVSASCLARPSFVVASHTFPSGTIRSLTEIWVSHKPVPRAPALQAAKDLTAAALAHGTPGVLSMLGTGVDVEHVLLRLAKLGKTRCDWMRQTLARYVAFFHGR